MQVFVDQLDGAGSSSQQFSSAQHKSLATWLIGAAGCSLVLLGSAVLGSSYTGLHGDWLEGNVQMGNEIFLAEVGLTEVRLITASGSSRTITLRAACAEAGGRDSDASHWCGLDQLGADTEAMLTAAFVPALVVLLLSTLTALQNWCTTRLANMQIDARAQALGVTSSLYSMAMLIAWSVFAFMCTSGLCVFAYRAPASLGVGRVYFSKSYGLTRAVVLFATLAAIALLARAFKLWDTQTVHLFLRDVAESRALKLWLYCVLGAQLLLYVPVSLVQLDYAPVVAFLGVNYLATRAPQMLWSYALITLATLPQDTAALSAVVTWSTLDLVDRVARVSLALVSLLKIVILVGFFLMHTRVRFKLQFFEFEQLDEEDGPPALGHGSPASPASPQGKLANYYSPQQHVHGGYASNVSPAPDQQAARQQQRRALDP